jgi:hypothetical protein
MRKHIAYLVLKQGRPFSFHVFLNFEVDELQYHMSSRTFNELLNQDKRSKSSSTTNDSASYSDVNLLSHPSDKYVGKECTSCLELQDQVTQVREALQRISIPTADQIPASEFEFIIPKEKYLIREQFYVKRPGLILLK